MANNIGSSFDYGTSSLPNANGPGNITLSDYSNKTLLISFVDIDTGWDSVSKLAQLVNDAAYSAIDGNVKVIIIAFKYAGGYQAIPATLAGQISSLSLNSTQLTRLVFLEDDTLFTDAHEELVGHQDYWSYIIGSDNVVSDLNPNAVADKWGSTDGWGTLLDADGYPGISFSALDFETGTALSTFSPSDDANLVEHLLERLSNLTSDPKVLYSKPAPGTWINSAFTTDIYFSKPMNPGTVPGAQANDTSNYLFPASPDHGEGWGSLTVAAATYLQVNNPANKVILTLIGTPSDMGSSKVFTIPARNIQDTYGEIGVSPPTDPLPNPVPFNADITPPTCSFFSPADGSTTTNASIGVTVTAIDPPGGGVGASSGVAGLVLQVGDDTLPADLSTIPWQSSGLFTLSLSTDGDYDNYAWAIDNAGNISATPAHITITKVTASISISAPTVTYKKYDPGTVLVTSTVNATLDVKGWKISASATPGTIPANINLISNAPYTFPAAESDGSKTLYLHVTDQNDTIESVSFTATKDTSDPVFTPDLTSDAVTNSPDVNLQIISTSDATSGIAGYFVSPITKPANVTGWLTWEANGNSWTAWDGTVPQNITHTLTTGGWGEKTLRIWVRDAAWNIAEHTVSVNYQMRRDIMLALDFSGSMRGQVFFDYDGQDGLVAGDYSKYAVLKSAVGWFVDLLKTWDEPTGVRGINDTIGGYIFRDHLELLQLPRPVDDGTSTGGDDLKIALETHSPPQSGQLTAMGAGMAKALLDLDYQNDDSTTGARRALLVVTDGMQNRLPVLTVEDSVTDTIDVTIDGANPGGIGTYQSSGDSNHTANDVDHNDFTGTVHYRKDPSGDIARNVQVNTLGIGDHEPWQQNLAKAALASRDDGEFLTNANGYNGVNDFFQAALTKVYSGNTPQTILNEKGYFSIGREKETVYDFDLNHTVSSIALVLSWAGNVPLTMTIRKGSTIINARITPSSFSKVAVIEFTNRVNSKPLYKKPLPEISPEGEWSVTIRPTVGSANNTKGAIPYFLAVMGEEKSLKLSWGNAPAVVSQGGKWKADFRISETGSFSSPIPSVAANLTGPAIHPGAILQEMSPQLINVILSNPMDGTLFAQLRNLAAAEPQGSLAKLVRQLDQKVSIPIKVRPVLPEKGKGVLSRYSGRLEAIVDIPEKPGIYRVDIVVTGRGKTCGAYRRVLSKSVIVPFKSDPGKTEIEPNNHGWIITPRDINGIPLGPGSAALFQVSKSDSVKDKGDGTYLVSSTEEKNKKAAMEIRIGEVPIRPSL